MQKYIQCNGDYFERSNNSWKLYSGAKI